MRIFSNTENKVELLGVYGSDITHCLSAWTSTSRDFEIPDRNGRTKKERMPALIKMLAENGHETPFEKSSLHFLCVTDIATHIQLLKHRIGTSLNAESARYKELKEDKLFIPTDWPKEEIEKYLSHMELAYENYHRSMESLTEHYMKTGLSKQKARSRAKETSRFYLPYGNQITCDVMFNFRSFAHFIKLRYSTHAQKEIRDLAFDMLKLIKNTNSFDISLNAFKFTDENGDIVPPFGNNQ